MSAPWSGGETYSGLAVLVTGADGFIGSHLVEHLFALGANVTAVCFHSPLGGCGWLDTLPAAIRQGLTLALGDVRDRAFVHRLLREQEIVFHLAALVSPRQSYRVAQSYIETNVLGTLNVLEAARDSRPRRVVHASTGEVYGAEVAGRPNAHHPLRGHSPYFVSKVAADMLVESSAWSYDVPVVILRPFDTFGPRQSERAPITALIRQVLDPAIQVIQPGELREARDLTFVTDIVSAFLAIGAAGQVEFGRAYDAGSGKARTLLEVLELLRAITGTEKPVVTAAVPQRELATDVAERYADSRNLELLTGWRPQLTLSDGLERTVGWWQQRLLQRPAEAETRYGS